MELVGASCFDGGDAPAELLYKYGSPDADLWEQRRSIARGPIEVPYMRSWQENELSSVWLVLLLARQLRLLTDEVLQRFELSIAQVFVRRHAALAPRAAV